MCACLCVCAWVSQRTSAVGPRAPSGVAPPRAPRRRSPEPQTGSLYQRGSRRATLNRSSVCHRVCAWVSQRTSALGPRAPSGVAPPRAPRRRSPEPQTGSLYQRGSRLTALNRSSVCHCVCACVCACVRGCRSAPLRWGPGPRAGSLHPAHLVAEALGPRRGHFTNGALG